MKVEVRVAECRRRQVSPSGLLCEHISNCDTTGNHLPLHEWNTWKQEMKKLFYAGLYVLCRSVCKPWRHLTISDQWSFAGPLKDIQRSLNHSTTPVLPWLCALSLFCWKVNLWPSLRSRVLCIRFLSSLSLYFTTCGFSPITINLSVPASTKENKKRKQKKKKTDNCSICPELLEWWSSRVITNSLNAYDTICKNEQINEMSRCHAEVLGDCGERL